MSISIQVEVPWSGRRIAAWVGRGCVWAICGPVSRICLVIVEHGHADVREAEVLARRVKRAGYRCQVINHDPHDPPLPTGDVSIAAL